MPNVDSLH
jgi:hypothetical protein